MMDYITIFKEWVITLGEKHGVDPLVLGCLYLISKVSFFTSLGLVIKNVRAKKPVIILLLLAGMFFSIPYLYIIIAGHNIAWWVYLLISLLFISGIYSIWKKVTVKTQA